MKVLDSRSIFPNYCFFIRKVDIKGIAPIYYGKEVLFIVRCMELYERKEKMVAVANICNARTCGYINSSGSEFLFVALYLCFILT